MKEIVGILLTAALIFALAGCTDTTTPAVDDTSSTISSETTSSKEETSSIPQSSVIESSETPSSMTEEEKVKPVSPPKDPNAEDPHEWTKEEMDAAWEIEQAEMAEYERLGKLTAEYTAELDKTTCPVGTKKIILTIKNKGP